MLASHVGLSLSISHWPTSSASATTAAEPTDQRQMSAPTSRWKKTRASARLLVVAVYQTACHRLSRPPNFAGVYSASSAIATAKSMPYATPTSTRPSQTVEKSPANAASSAPATAKTLASSSGGTRPIRVASQPPTGLKTIASAGAVAVSTDIWVLLSSICVVIGPSPALSAAFEYASRKSPPNTRNQMTRARPAILLSESMSATTSATPLTLGRGAMYPPSEKT